MTNTKFKMVSAMREVKQGNIIYNEVKDGNYFRLGIIEDLYENVAFEQTSRDKEEIVMKISEVILVSGRSTHVRTNIIHFQIFSLITVYLAQRIARLDEGALVKTRS